MSLGKKRILRVVLSVGVLALLVLYARSVRWRVVWLAMRGASPTLLTIAALANLVTLFAKAFIWWIFLRPVGAPSLDLSIRATAAGAALNNILIANSGDAARAVFVARASNASVPGVLAALALERLFDLIGYVILLIGAAFLVPLPADLTRWRMAAVGILCVIIVLLGALLVRPPRPPPVAPAHLRLALGARIRGAMGRFGERLGHIVTVRRLGAAFALTVVNWAAQVVSYHLSARAAHLPITLGGSVATLVAANVGFLLRVTPGNVGVFQLVYAVTAQTLGLSRDAAVGAAVLLQAIQNVPVTLLGVVLAPDLLLGRRSAKRAAADPQATP